MSTILVVDDESEMVLVLEKFFRRNGFRVIGVSGGQKALSILQTDKKIDMMILDMRMPGIKGIEVLEKLKEQALMVPVVILTGSLNFSHFVERMISLGYSEEDVFYKPVKLEDLLKHVNKRLSERLKKTKQKKAKRKKQEI